MIIFRFMSKSDESDYSRGNLTDDAETIALKFRKAKSDSLPTIGYDPEGRPEASNLINIYAAFAGTTREAVVQEFEGRNFSDFKKALSELAIEKLSPITAYMRDLLRNADYIYSVLKDGADKASAIAQKYMREIKEITGFLTF